MAGRRVKPVLYEVAARRGSLRRLGRESTYARSSSTPPPNANAEQAPTAPVATQPPQKRADPTGEDGSIRDRIVGLRVTVSATQLGIGGVVVLAALLLAFQAGRTVERTGSPDNQLANVQNPAENDFTGNLTQGDASTGDTRATRPASDVTPADSDVGRGATNRANADVFQPGFQYVAVQFFPSGRRESANAARRYLEAQGIPATVLDRKVDLVLLANQPFLLDQQDAAAARDERRRRDQFIARIKDLGKTYNRTMQSGYDFGGARPYLYRGDNRFVSVEN